MTLWLPCKHWLLSLCQATAAFQILENGYLHLKIGLRTVGEWSRSVWHMVEFEWTVVLENKKEILLNWFLRHKCSMQMFPSYVGIEAHLTNGTFYEITHQPNFQKLCFSSLIAFSWVRNSLSFPCKNFTASSLMWSIVQYMGCGIPFCVKIFNIKYITYSVVLLVSGFLLLAFVL